MQLHLFGATTPSGEAFRLLLERNSQGMQLLRYSRRQAGSHPLNLVDPASFVLAGTRGAPGLLISFAPIWLLAPFLDHLRCDYPERIQDLCGVISCSSSSTLTKRYAANRSDRDLVARLIGAEDQLLDVCQQLDIPCCILRPSLIYGKAGPYGDKNLSRLIVLMRRLPLLPLPAQSGLRQPIHVGQLASVALRFAQQLAGQGGELSLPQRLAVGGDSSLSYSAMIRALQDALPAEDPARRCLLLAVPNRFFWLLAFPVLIRSPKSFEAIMRMSADLAGFLPSHQLLGDTPQPFPVLPLAI